MDKIKTTYSTDAVCKILSAASGKTVTPEDVRNLSRKGCALHRAVVQRGAFEPKSVQIVAQKMTRRRLAADLGRISPRFLDSSNSRRCRRCSAIAVEWGGQVKCENGHTYIEAVDKGKPGGDHTAVASITRDGTVLDIRIFPAGSEDEEILQDLADHG